MYIIFTLLVLTVHVIWFHCGQYEVFHDLGQNLQTLTLVAWQYLLIFPWLPCIKVHLGQSKVITRHLINTPHTPNTDTSFTPKSCFFFL